LKKNSSCPDSPAATNQLLVVPLEAPENGHVLGKRGLQSWAAVFQLIAVV
jgi:hypothetical protein